MKEKTKQLLKEAWKETWLYKFLILLKGGQR